jgi:hypothetical protein
MVHSAKARLKVSTGQLRRGSAGRAFGRAIKKSPGDITGAKPMLLKTISKPTRTARIWRRCIGPTDWQHTKPDRAGKKEAPSLGVRGAEEVSTTIYCIHIPRAMKEVGEWLGILRPVNEFEDTNVG